MGVRLQTPTGDAVYVKTDTRSTQGSLTVLEFEIAPRSGPALHTHLREDEVGYVLEGEFRFKAGGAMFKVSAGGMAFGPRCTPHNFQNIGDGTGRLLVVTAPSGAERLFEEYNHLLPGPVSADRLSALGHANWVEFVGPPLAISDPLEQGRRPGSPTVADRDSAAGPDLAISWHRQAMSSRRALRVSMLMAVALGWALLVLGLAVLAFLIARHNR